MSPLIGAAQTTALCLVPTPIGSLPLSGAASVPFTQPLPSTQSLAL